MQLAMKKMGEYVCEHLYVGAFPQITRVNL